VRGSVISRMILLPFHRSSIESSLAVNFMNQHVTTVAVVDHRLTRTTVAGDYYGAIRSLESIAERFRPRAVVNSERLHRHVVIRIDDTRSYLVRNDSEACLVRRLASVQPDPDIFAISSGD